MEKHENTFKALKSISSSEQFTEGASWCAILTYIKCSHWNTVTHKVHCACNFNTMRWMDGVECNKRIGRHEKSEYFCRAVISPCVTGRPTILPLSRFRIFHTIRSFHCRLLFPFCLFFSEIFLCFFFFSSSFVFSSSLLLRWSLFSSTQFRLTQYTRPPKKFH